MNRSYGRNKVKKVRADLSDIPKDCGYEKKFQYNIDMNSNGVAGECIEWCQINCEGKWGWWFEQSDLYDPLRHNWEAQDSYMSFENKKDASRFWMEVGVQNMGNRDR